MMPKTILTAAVAALIAMTPTLELRAETRPQVGSKAPEFTLRTLDGEPVGLAAMLERGPVVLIQLRGWVGYQCPICTAQVGEFMGRIEDFRAAGANIIAVYPGQEAEVQQYAEEFVAGKAIPGNFHFVLDPGLVFTNLYGLRWDAPNETAYPATFLIDPGGTVRFAKISRTHGGRAGAEEILALLR